MFFLCSINYINAPVYGSHLNPNSSNMIIEDIEEKYFLSFKPAAGFYNVNWSKIDDGVIYGATVNYRKKNLLLSTDYFIFQKIMGSKKHQLGFSGGIRYGERFVLDFQIGAGVIWTYENTWQKLELTTPQSTFAINVKPGFKVVPVKYLAIGLDAFVCFNKFENLYAIPMLSLEFGIIR
jgi:hypothetical protein